MGPDKTVIIIEIEGSPDKAAMDKLSEKAMDSGGSASIAELIERVHFFFPHLDDTRLDQLNIDLNNVISVLIY